MGEVHCRLTPEVETEIVNYILTGGFPHICAEAAGIPARVFAQWLAKGRKRTCREKYRIFARNVAKTVAQARMHAEGAVYNKDPAGWLAKGPGRDRPGLPGWSQPVRAVVKEASRNPDASAEVLRLLGIID